MESLTFYQILFLIIPFIVWIIGMKKKIPALVFLAGAMLVILPLYYGMPFWIFLTLGLMGLGLVIGSVYVSKVTST